MRGARDNAAMMLATRPPLTRKQMWGRLLAVVLLCGGPGSIGGSTQVAAPLSKTQAASTALKELEQAPVVAVVRVDTRTERIARTFEGIELGSSNGRPRTYLSHAGEIIRIVHLNGHSADDPALSGGIEIEQVEREKRGFDFELGHTYLVLLRRSTHWYWTPDCSKACVLLPAPFELTAEQSGYEVKAGRLRVLRRGGPLDALDRKSVEDITAALDPKTP